MSLYYFIYGKFNFKRNILQRERQEGIKIMRDTKYYDIGLNLFCKQFPEPEKIIKDAADSGVCCILTGTDSKENSKIDEFVKGHEVFGTAGIHPHNADQAKQEDFQKLRKFYLKIIR